jgi:DNA-binding MurR/RpiR family transcriptional regulator
LEEFGPSERFEKVSTAHKNLEGIVSSTFEMEIHNLRETRKGIDLGRIEEIVHAIIAARMKYIIGLRTTSGCAYLLGRILSHILPNVLTILDGDVRMYENLRAIGKKDVLITISYPRYLKNTVEALQFAKLRKATTIAITDSKLSPTAQISKYSIIAPSNSQTFANSYTACLFAINLLTAAIIQIHDGKKMKVVLNEWEKSLEPFKFFYKND